LTAVNVRSLSRHYKQQLAAKNYQVALWAERIKNMFLKITGMTLPDWALIHSVSDDPKLKEWQGKKEHCFCPLEETLWADDVKKKITKIYKAVGVPDPMKQKLVEPYAGCFGGKNKEGACDFSKVNWQALLDYFEWESYNYEKRNGC